MKINEKLHCNQIILLEGSLYIVKGQFVKWIDAFKHLINFTRESGKFLHFIMAKTTPENGNYYLLQQVGKAGRKDFALEKAINILTGLGFQLEGLSFGTWTSDDIITRTSPGETAGFLRIDNSIESIKEKYTGHQNQANKEFIQWILDTYSINGMLKEGNFIEIYKQAKT